jgi:aubergine-like protein
MMLSSNLFHFQPISECHIYQYHVDFSPDVPSKRLRMSMINSQAAVLGPIRITDGMLLFLPNPLPTEETELFAKRKVRQAELPESEEIIKITVKFTGEVQPNTNTVLQIYNILFKRVLQHLGMTLIQRSYFNPNKAHHLDQFQVDIWPGYSTAIGLYERQIALVADVSHKVIKTSTVYDFMKQLKGNKELISAKLIGKIVMTRYNNKTYRVDDIDWKQNPMSAFKLRNGTEQRYMDYYKNAYSCDIHDPHQPLLMSMPKKRDVRAGQEGFICLIPELCIVTGIDDDMRNDFRMMQDFAKVTRVGPHERARELEALSEEIANNPAARKELADWNLELSGRLAEVKGRVMDKEIIRMTKGRELSNVVVDNDASWSRNMRDVKVTVPVALEKQQWLCIYPKSTQEGVNLFMNDLLQVGRSIGMNIGEPVMVALSFNPRQMEYLETIRTNCDKNYKMVFVVLGSNDKQVYDAAKVELCIQRAIPSQFIVKKTIMRDKGRKSVATKVALQMNCKLGGELWETDMPMSNAMVVGIDTFHDSASKKRSAVGFVASLNKSLTRYYSRSFLQDQNEELAKGLNSAMTACLKKYLQVNQALPTRIFIFRDGVGDGMLSMVEDFEIRQIEEAFKTLQPGYEPMLSVIVVKKRMNTRIFRVDNRNRSQVRYDNPLPGTVVDDVITKPMWYDFFIVSQSVNQGTVAPTHYHVLRDGSKFNVNIMQRLTYKLCHLYYNWPGTIRVPAPCQYAHKLAFLVGQSLHKPPHVELCDKLFYL